MPSDKVTLRISADLVAQIDALARQRGCQALTLVDVAVQSPTPRTQPATGDLEDVRARLRAPLQAQAEFLDTASISDEWRSF